MHINPLRQSPVRIFELAILITLLTGSALAIGLRGAVPAQTIRILEGPRYIGSTYGEREIGGSNGYTENFTGWYVGFRNPTVTGALNQTTNGLTLDGYFEGSSSSTSIAIFKRVSINISVTPILEAHLSVSAGVAYGLRFFADYPNGTSYNVWWEGSPLDHRPGRGDETIRINMQREAFLATGYAVGSLSLLELYIEEGVSTARNYHLDVSSLAFNAASFDPIRDGGAYRAVYLDLVNLKEASRSWQLVKIQLGANITASPESRFHLYLFDGPREYVASIAGEVAYSPLAPYHKFTFYPDTLQLLFPELLPRTNSSLVLVASSGTIQSAQFDSLDLIYTLEWASTSVVSSQRLDQFYGYLILFMFLIPLGSAVALFRKYFRVKKIQGLQIAAVLGIGLVCRIAVGLVASHEFDMNVWTTSARGWFQYGNSSGSIGPTLPTTYFLYWSTYSFYAVLQILGFQDSHFLLHSSGTLEGVFLKLFPMLMDALVFLTLVKVRYNGSSLVWGSFFFLNPLAILVSSIWGQYDVAAVFFIVWGVYSLTQKSTTRAGFAFVFSGMIQILGFVPYAFLLLKNSLEKKLRMILIQLAVLSLAFLYPLERDLLLREFYAVLGITTALTYSSPGKYSLIGSLPSLSFALNLHPLLIAGGALLATAAYLSLRRRLNAETILLLTVFTAISLLLFSDLLAAWVWLLPLGLFYGGLKDKEALGAFALVFGATTAFLMMSFTLGTGYLIVGDPGYAAFPAIEAVRNGLQIFTIATTILTGLFIFYLVSNRGSATGTLVRSSLITLGLFVALYMYVGVVPV